MTATQIQLTSLNCKLTKIAAEQSNHRFNATAMMVHKLAAPAPVLISAGSCCQHRRWLHHTAPQCRPAPQHIQLAALLACQAAAPARYRQQLHSSAGAPRAAAAWAAAAAAAARLLLVAACGRLLLAARPGHSHPPRRRGMGVVCHHPQGGAQEGLLCWRPPAAVPHATPWAGSERGRLVCGWPAAALAQGFPSTHAAIPSGMPQLWSQRCLHQLLLAGPALLTTASPRWQQSVAASCRRRSAHLLLTAPCCAEHPLLIVVLPARCCACCAGSHLLTAPGCAASAANLLLMRLCCDAPPPPNRPCCACQAGRAQRVHLAAALVPVQGQAGPPLPALLSCCGTPPWLRRKASGAQLHHRQIGRTCLRGANMVGLRRAASVR